MKLFAGPVSPLCAKARIALDEKGLDHECYLDRALAVRDYLAGDAFTVADLTNAFATRSAQQMGAPLDTALAGFGPWYRRITERPAFVAQIARVEAFGAGQRGAAG